MNQVISTPKEVGLNNWVYYNNGGLKSSASYLYALQDGIAKKFMNIYWDEGISKKNTTFNNNNSVGVSYELFRGVNEINVNPKLFPTPLQNEIDSQFTEFSPNLSPIEKNISPKA